MMATKLQAIEAIKSAMETAARLILQSPVAAKLTPRDREDMQEWATGEAFDAEHPHRRFSLGILSVEDRYEDTNLIVDFGTFGPEVKYEADGSVTHTWKRKIEINWSSHGSCDFKLAVARVKTYQEVCELAQALADALPESISWCHQTAEERKVALDKAQAEREAMAIDRRVYDLTASVRSGMRVGSVRDVPMEYMPGLPLLSRKVELDGKTYLVNFDPTSARGSVRRTA